MLDICICQYLPIIHWGIFCWQNYQSPSHKRTLQLRHFDVQILGGIALHEGQIAEMATGEGKTLVAILPAFLNALTGWLQEIVGSVVKVAIVIHQW